MFDAKRLTALAVLLLTLILGGEAFGAQPCGGKPLVSVQLKGCKRAQCGEKTNAARLKALLGLELGQPVSEEALTLGAQRLRDSGFFASVTLTAAVARGRCQVTATVVPNRFVEEISVEGQRYFFRKDLEKRLFIRPGSVFNPSEKEYQEKLLRQQEVLVSYMAKRGFNQAAIKPLVVPLGRDKVSLVLRVNEGPSQRISRFQVHLSQRQGAKGFACPVVSPRQLVAVADPGSGTPWSKSVERDLKKNLKLYLQQYGFISPTVKVVFNPEERFLEVFVQVNRCYSIVVQDRAGEDLLGESAENWRTIQDEAVYEALPFRDSGVFDRSEAELGIEEILGWYQQRGFLFARVDMDFLDHRELNSHWTEPLLGIVRYRVTTGDPAEIRSLSFQGNRQMPTATIQEQMQTRQYDFFDEGGFLLVDQFFADLEKVKRHYRNNGYPSMGFTGAAEGAGEEGAREEVSLEIQRFRDRTQYSYVLGDKALQVSKNDWENPVYIVVGIHEGPQSVFSSVEFSGVEALERSSLPVELRRSAPYSPFLLQRGLAGLKRTYENLGYRKVELEASCSEQSMEGEFLPCALFPAAAQHVKLRVAVKPGPRSYMGELFIHGLRRSSVSMIEGLFPRDGEPFDKDRMDGGLKTLRNLGIFSSVRASYVGQEETPPREKVPVVIWVEEGGNRFMDVSLGFQTISRPGEDRLMDPLVSDLLSRSIHNVSSLMTGRSGFQRINFPDLLLMTEVSYTDRNFLGLAKELTLPVSYGLSTTDLFRYASFMPTYVDRRFLGLDLTMRLTPLIEYDRALRELDIFEYGVETELSHWLQARRIQLSLLTRLSRISWKEIYEPDFGPLESQIKATPQVRFDWRNSPTNPSKGAFLGLRCSYINALNESGDRDNFVKYDASTQAYLPFRNILVLAGNVRAGGSVSGLGADLPANHRFRLGGTSGVRGFPAGGILQYRTNGTPRTESATMSVSGSNQKGYLVVNDGDYVLNGSVELRYPLLRKSDLWGSVFLDWGAITESFSELTSNSFRFTVGPGVRWLLGGQIPLRVDYGFVLDRRFNKVDFQTGKPSARDSAGALDFGILYTF